MIDFQRPMFKEINTNHQQTKTLFDTNLSFELSSNRRGQIIQFDKDCVVNEKIELSK